VDVPIVQDIIDSGRVPDGLNLYGVNTGTDETRANYPPTKWLIAEGWTPPTLLDDEANTAASALGLTAYPYWIVLDGEGRVVTRRSGELTEEAILELMNVAVGIASPDAVDEGESSSADG